MLSSYRNMITPKGVRIGGLAPEYLASQFGTPLYAYDAGIIRLRHQEFSNTLPKGLEIFYSAKANPNVAVLSLLAKSKSGADVASKGELLAVKKAGFPPEKIVFGSPVKSAEEIRLAMEMGVYAINAESKRDAEKIAEQAESLHKKQRIGMRINPAFSIEGAMQSGGGSQKFGIDEEKAVEAIKSLNSKWAYVGGIHVFAASGVLDASALADYVKKVFALADRVAAGAGIKLEFVDIGSGIGVPYSEGEKDFDLKLFSELISDVVAAHKDCRLILESGRYLVAESGAYIAKVAEVKESRGRTFVLVDGGIHHFLRPALMGSDHQVYSSTRPNAKAEIVADVCGPLCTSKDVIARNARLPRVSEGDLLVFMNAGAYGYTESMPFFLSRRTACEVMVDGPSTYLIRRGITEEEMLAFQGDV